MPKELKMNKRCSKCKCWLPISKFHKNRAKKDGLCHWCKICIAQADHIRYRKRNPVVKRLKYIDRYKTIAGIKLKQCSGCRIWRSLNEFCKNKSRKGGLDDRCRVCHRIYAQSEAGIKAGEKWRHSHIGCRVKRKSQLKRKFNLTLEQYDRMFEQQNGKCAICDQTEISNKELSVDHDHQTGEIRGLLCMNCNLLLGKIESTPELFSKIVKYLQGMPEKAARSGSRRMKKPLSLHRLADLPVISLL